MILLNSFIDKNITKVKSSRDEKNQWVVDWFFNEILLLMKHKTEGKSVFSLKINEIFTYLRWDFVTALISNIYTDSI